MGTGKRATMKDIATQLNLSINAVSLALNDRVGVSEDTRREVLRVAEEIGYLEHTSKYMSTYSSKNICVLLRSIYFRDMHFYSKILIGVEQEARKSGYDLLINFYEEEFRVPNCVENKRVAGVVVVGKIEDTELMMLKKHHIPIILVDHTSLSESTDSILTDNKLGAFKVTRYLIDKGYKKIGFFGDLDYSISVKERFFGYQEAIKLLPNLSSQHEVNLYTEKYSLLNDIEKHIIAHDTEQIIKRIKEIDTLPEACVCSNDNAAIQLCNALRMLDYKVPVDISVVGFDDIELCSMITPKMTTVKVNKELMGKKAIQRLIWRINHLKEPVENIILNVEIVERESVK